MKRMIVAALAALGIGAAGIVGASPAQADGYRYVVTHMEWSDGNSFDQIQYALPGQWIGSNPIIAGRAWVSCTVYVNGRYQYGDFAALGDGHDADCTGVAY